MEKYGVTFRDGISESVIELQMAFDVGSGVGSLRKAKGYLGPFEHLKRATDLIVNMGNERGIIWNEWSEKILRVLVEGYHRGGEVVIAGPSASWKSTCVAWFIVAAWLSDPLRTKCPVSSTSLGSLRELLWKDILKFYRVSRANFGNVIQHPHPKIQTLKGDDSSGIYGVAVEQGDTEAAIERLKGRHAPKVIVGIDEGPGALPAIVDACVNLRSGCEKFMLIMMGNPLSYFDQHGRLAEPEKGWSSVSVESSMWNTKRGGVCLHLDGLKAPNVLAKKKKYPGMLSQEDLDSTAQQYGENSPRFWQERRGFWPPEGITKTVLTPSIIETFRARERATWVGETVMGAALDPAFEGGDRRVLRFGKYGEIDVTKKEWTPNGLEFGKENERLAVIEFGEIMLLKIDITSSEPIHYQLARQVRDECAARGVASKYFALDVSGEGGGLAAILKREWALDFLEIEFGGLASERKLSAVNPRKGREEYANRVSELWYQFRYAVERGQVRGLDAETAQEFCQREYEMTGTPARVVVEPKKKMKDRIGHSPDLADAAVVMWELFRQRQPELSTDKEINVDRRWREFVDKFNVNKEEEAYAEWNVS
jgi:hypothetical protein